MLHCATLWDSNFFVHHQDYYCAMPAVLSRVLPNAKFIVLMQNPVTRLYSHYLHTCANRHCSKVLFKLPIITGMVDMITHDGIAKLRFGTRTFFVHHQDYCAMPAVLSRVLPNAKFIVLMRNPVTSHYLHTCADRHCSKVLFKLPKQLQQYASNFHREVVADVEHFKGNRSLYECVNDNRFRSIACGGVGFRITVGLLCPSLQVWLQFYPKEYFLLLTTEDISADPHSLMTKITQSFSE